MTSETVDWIGVLADQSNITLDAAISESFKQITDLYHTYQQNSSEQSPTTTVYELIRHCIVYIHCLHLYVFPYYYGRIDDSTDIYAQCVNTRESQKQAFKHLFYTPHDLINTHDYRDRFHTIMSEFADQCDVENRVLPTILKKLGDTTIESKQYSLLSGQQWHDMYGNLIKHHRDTGNLQGIPSDAAQHKQHSSDSYTIFNDGFQSLNKQMESMDTHPSLFNIKWLWLKFESYVQGVRMHGPLSGQVGPHDPASSRLMSAFEPTTPAQLLQIPHTATHRWPEAT